MNKLFVSLYMLSFFFNIPVAKSQSVDEIISKYIAAMGGADKLHSLKTVKRTGSMSVMGADVDITLTTKHLVGNRLDLSVMGTQNYQVTTPTKGFSYMPIQGILSVTPMSADQLKLGQSTLDLEGALVDYKAKGSSIVLQNHRDVEGQECFVLALTDKNQLASTFYISTTSYLILQSTANRDVNGKQMAVTTTYKNFKKNDGGYLFAYTVTNSQGTIEYSKIETNIPVADTIFSEQ